MSDTNEFGTVVSAQSQRVFAQAAVVQAKENQAAEVVKTFLSGADILATNDTPAEEIYIPEWKTHVLFRPLSTAEALTFFEMNKKNPMDALVRIVMLSLVDVNGKQLFTKEQFDEVSKKSFKVMTRLQEVAMRLNGLDNVKASTAAAKNG